MNRFCFLFVGSAKDLRGHLKFLKAESRGRIKDTVPLIVSQANADFLKDKARFVEALVFDGDESSMEDALAWAKRKHWRPTVLQTEKA